MTPLRGWAAGRQGTRMKCDYCGRIIVKPDSRSIPCTACGHGHLREMKPGSWGTWGPRPPEGLSPKGTGGSSADEDIVERVKRLYTIIVNGELGDDEDSLCKRVCIVRELEAITHKDFRNTAEFHREVSAFLARKSRIKETEGARFRRARRRAGLTIKELAVELGVTKRTVIRWERNESPLSASAVEWLNKTLSDAPGSNDTEKEPYGEKMTLVSERV